MKTSIFYAGRMIIGIGLFLISFTGNSQEKLSREEKKEIKRDKAYYNFQVVDSMIENKRFVLEADYLENKFGIRHPVSSLLNFIRVDSNDAVLQTGSDMYQGYNDLGGVTAEGSIQGLKISKNMKDLSFFLRFTVMTNIGIYDVAMTIHSDKYARAEISGLGPGKLIYSGRVLNPWESKAYKGRNTI